MSAVFNCTGQVTPISLEQLRRIDAAMRALPRQPVVEVDGVRCYQLLHGATLTRDARVVGIDSTQRTRPRSRA